MPPSPKMGGRLPPHMIFLKEDNINYNIIWYIYFIDKFQNNNTVFWYINFMKPKNKNTPFFMKNPIIKPFFQKLQKQNSKTPKKAILCTINRWDG
jgi:hypothetical protein